MMVNDAVNQNVYTLSATANKRPTLAGTSDWCSEVLVSNVEQNSSVFMTTIITNDSMSIYICRLSAETACMEIHRNDIWRHVNI